MQRALKQRDPPWREQDRAKTQEIQRKMRVVIVADDFGYCECRSRGISECATFLSATSVLVTHPMTSLVPACAVGLHLNLTEGLPLCRDASSLVDERTGLMLGKLGVRNVVLKANDVRREIEAQIKEFEARYGRLPSHVDGHNHVHLLPVVATELANMLSELQHRRGCNIWTRIPFQLVRKEQHPWVSGQSLAFFELIERECVVAAPIYEAKKIPFCRSFVGLSTQGGMGTKERVLQAFDHAGDLVEWMVHPGYACSSHEWSDDFGQSSDRELEMRLIKAVVEELEKKGIKIERR